MSSSSFQCCHFIVFNFYETESFSMFLITSVILFTTEVQLHNYIVFLIDHIVEAVVERCSVKKVFLEISQNSQENTCARVSFLIKLQPKPAALLKKRLWHRCFPVNFVKFLRTPFYMEYLW